MPFEHFIRSGNRMLRCGFTTGTCAALAASGAVRLLLTGEMPRALSIRTPKGLIVETEPEEISLDGETARCAIRKDAGDDPDVTDGMLIFASARKCPRGVAIDGGEGIGRVTKPGLDQPVGAAAINKTPRQMIRAAVDEVCAEAGYGGGIEIMISAPEGTARAMRTFNPMLGIEGGISILGTSGIVEPMSEQALVDTIAVEAHQAARSERSGLVLTPGNYGLDFLNAAYPELGRLPRVKYSNYLGEAIDIAVLEGFEKTLVVGHFGKLVKLAGGIMNTHSKNADCRREILCAHTAVCGAGREICEALMNEVTTDGCIAVLDGAGLREAVMERILAAMQAQLDRRTGGGMPIGAVTFSNEYGLLGMTETARRLLAEWGRK